VSYRVVLRASLTRTVQSWALPDSVFVELHLRLNRLSKAPAEQLVRLRKPFDGMVFAFSIIDPNNRLCEHLFAFKIMYGQDEERLHVVRGQYVRRYA
jgi:hypothetical protein